MMTNDDVKAQLERTAPFSGFSEPEREALAAAVSLRSYPQGRRDPRAGPGAS